MTTTVKPILYSYWRSSCSWRVRIALAYKRIEYEYHAVNLIKDGGEQKQPAYAAINPSRLVPSLAIDGHVLAQSIAILEYLEESRPELPSLLPRDLFARAAVRAIVNTIAADTQPVQNLRVLNKVAEIGGDKTEWANHWITTNFKSLESLLAHHSGKYCVGDEITLADVCLVPQVFNATRFGVDMSQFPTIQRINAVLEEREEFKAAHPDAQPDKPPPSA